MVSPGFFQVLSTQPLLGATFDPREDAGVSETSKEIGIRSALGEPRSVVAGRVFRTALARCLWGTACGLAAVPTLSHVAGSGLGPQFQFDYWVLPPIVGVMLLVSVLTSVFPALRSLSISPSETLKAE